MTVSPQTSGEGSTSPVKIFANIFISFIGAGVLGLPYAFKEAGILEGIVVMILVAVVSIQAMLLIVACKYRLIQKQTPTLRSSSSAANHLADAEKLLPDLEPLDGGGSVRFEEPTIPKAPGHELTYGDVGYYSLGNAGRVLVEVAILISQVGFCCAYLIFISENLSDYISGLKLKHWLAILLPPLSGLCMLRHLNSLALSSLFAQLSNLLAFGVVFWFDLEHLYNVKLSPKEFSLEGLPFFTAIGIYCYEGAGMILALEASLAKEIRPSFTKYFVFTLVLVTTLYVTFGVCGYLSFGNETNEIITLNLPKGESLDFAIVVKSCLCLALFFTYPVMMFPVINIIEKKLIPNPTENIWPGNLLRIVLVLLTGFVVLAIPNFANLMALVGATCCTMLAFTLPGLFHLKIFQGDLTRRQYIFDIFLITIGIVGAVVCTGDALNRLQQVHKQNKIITTQPPPAKSLQNLTGNSTVGPSISWTAGVTTELFNHPKATMVPTPGLPPPPVTVSPVQQFQSSLNRANLTSFNANASFNQTVIHSNTTLT